MPEEIDFNFTPQDALDYFRNKEEQRMSWSYREIWEDEHKRAFTVAKMTKANLLNDVYQSLERAIEEGQSYEEWREKILNKLERTWIGKTYGELWDEMSPEERAKHKSPTKSERERVIKESRLKTIFRTNMFSAYQAGRYRQMSDDVENYPYWRYVTMDDDAVRPAHAKMHGVIFRHDNPFWQTHFPPNGYNCRCEVEALDDFDIEAQGLTVETDPTPYTDCVDEGWDYNGGDVELAQHAIKQKAEKFPEKLYEQLELDFEDEFKRLKEQKEARDREKLAQQSKEEKAPQVKANKVKPVQTNEVKHIKVKEPQDTQTNKIKPIRTNRANEINRNSAQLKVNSIIKGIVNSIFGKKLNIADFIRSDGKFNIESFKKAIRYEKIEHAVILDREGKLFSYACGDETSASFMDEFIKFLKVIN